MNTTLLKQEQDRMQREIDVALEALFILLVEAQNPLSGNDNIAGMQELADTIYNILKEKTK